MLDILRFIVGNGFWNFVGCRRHCLGLGRHPRKYPSLEEAEAMSTDPFIMVARLIATFRLQRPDLELFDIVVTASDPIFKEAAAANGVSFKYDLSCPDNEVYCGEAT